MVGDGRPANAQWHQTAIPSSVYIGCITTTDTYVYVGTDSAVYVSTDGGMLWSRPANAGMQERQVVYALLAQDTIVWAATANQGVFKSSDHGASWQEANSGLPVDQKLSLAAGDSGVFVGTQHGVYFTTDAGLTWNPRNQGMANRSIWELVVDTGGGAGIILLAGASSGGGVFRSTDRGLSWTPVSASWSDKSIWALALGSEGVVYAGTERDGVYRSWDHGVSWEHRGLPNNSVQGMVVVSDGWGGRNVLAGTFDSSMYSSPDEGLSWFPSGAGITGRQINAVSANRTHVFAGLFRGGMWRAKIIDLIVTAIEEGGDRSPRTLALGTNFPNPFNSVTTIEFTLAHRSLVSVVVSDLNGRVLAGMMDRRWLDGGRHRVRFDAADLATGIYFYTVEARRPDGVFDRQVGRMIHLK